ncbi:MAG: hypothetical protein WBD02_01305 [Acidimicrobiia bacterium]
MEESALSEASESSAVFGSKNDSADLNFAGRAASLFRMSTAAPTIASVAMTAAATTNGVRDDFATAGIGHAGALGGTAQAPVGAFGSTGGGGAWLIHIGAAYGGVV